jgi:hypothetical protein
MDAPAVYLQSEGGGSGIRPESAVGNGGDILLGTASGEAIVGGRSAAAVEFAGGRDNRLVNRGALMSLAAIDGLAMRGGAGNDRIDNTGMLVGNLGLGGGTNALANLAGGRVLSGASLDLGNTGNRFDNAGVLSPGGTGRALRTGLNGSFVQGAGAVAEIELDFASETVDALHATGDAVLDGRVALQLLAVPSLRPGAFVKPLFSAEGSFSDAGLVLAAPRSVVLQFGLDHAEPQAVRLAYSVDFAARGALRRNLASVGTHLNGVQAAGGAPALADLVTALVDIEELADYRDALTQLSPDLHAAQQANVVRAAQQFGRGLMRCSAHDEGERFVAQDACLWLRMDRPSVDLDAHDDVPAMRHRGVRTAVGGQLTQGNWAFGAGASWEDFDAAGYHGAWRSDGDTRQVGLTATYQADATSLAAALTRGWTSASMRRRIDIPGEGLAPSVARGDQDLGLTGLSLRLDHRFPVDGLTFTPGIEFATVRLESEDDVESGAGAIGLRVESDEQWFHWVRPGIEIAWTYDATGRWSLQPFVRASLLHYLGTDEAVVHARLAGAPDGAVSIRPRSGLGQDQRVFEAGLDWMSDAGYRVRLRLERSHGDDVEVDQATLEFALPL